MNDQHVLATGQADLVAHINVAASTDQPVLLYGPKDSGREWVAELIHDLSSRNERPFLVVNCIASPSHAALVELSHPVRRNLNELLQLAGDGLLESVTGGTVWLNNLSDLPAEEQKALVSKLSDELDCRIITGITRQGGTRSAPDHTASLFKDKHSIQITPVRNQKQCIKFFVNYFFAKANIEWNREVPGFDDEARDLLLNYAWPGNLTELREAVREAVLLGKNGVPVPSRILPASVRSFQSQDPLFLKKAVLRAEYDLICKTLYETRNNKRKAAQILKISRKTLYSKMRVFQQVISEEATA